MHCSFCSKRGVLWAYYPPAQFQLTSPAADDATYRWNTKLVGHHFCPVCGCDTFTDSPAFEPNGSWDKRSPHRRQRASVRQLRCGGCACRGDRRQEPVVVALCRNTMLDDPIDPIAAVSHHCPYPYYAALRAESGVHWFADHELWALVGAPRPADSEHPKRRGG